MVLQLDPRLPLVWRSPDSLQFGVDDPPVVLTEVSGAQEQMIAALTRGVSRDALGMIAAASGAGDSEAERLLALVERALDQPATGAVVTGGQVTIAGSGPTVAILADALASSGVRVLLAGVDRAAAAAPTDLAVVVGHFVIDPDFYGLWLRRDQPHLPIVWGDTGARIGPFVEPGTGPCLHCLERFRTEADPAWPAIASQLWGRRSPLDAGLTAGEVATTAARLVLARLIRDRPGDAMVVQLDAATGVTSRTSAERHPECGCAALPGTVTAVEAPIGSVAIPPMTTEDVAWLA